MSLLSKRSSNCSSTLSCAINNTNNNNNNTFLTTNNFDLFPSNIDNRAKFMPLSILSSPNPKLLNETNTNNNIALINKETTTIKQQKYRRRDEDLITSFISDDEDEVSSEIKKVSFDQPQNSYLNDINFLLGSDQDATYL